jgi:hypothetical protein
MDTGVSMTTVGSAPDCIEIEAIVFLQVFTSFHKFQQVLHKFCTSFAQVFNQLFC